MTVANITTILKGQHAAHASNHASTTPYIRAADWEQIRKRYVTFCRAADALAADANEQNVTIIPFDLGAVITGVYLIPNGALTANSTDYKTVTIQHRVAGGTATKIAELTTKLVGAGGTGNWVANTAITFTLQAAANLAIPQNGAISILTAAGGSGVAMPSTTFVIEYKDA